MEDRPESSSSHDFEYSPENPPPLEALESKVFAVHATPTLPKKGILTAGARDISSDKKWGDEPPSFRPTIHFSLGELVQEHSEQSWDKSPFAVVTPLKSLEGQLVNIFPHDTFILGDYHLTEKDTLLVPRGTDASELPANLNTVEYNPQMGLRNAVDQVIREKGGWSIRMKPEGVAIGSVAYIEDTEVNSSEFFQSLFDAFPQLSYGTHLEAERGDAFRFGVIEQTVNSVMKNYSNHWFTYSSVQVQLHKSLIEHNLVQLEKSLSGQSLSAEALQAFEDKRGKLAGWLNIINADLETRQRIGRTFIGAPEWIQEELRKVKDDPEALKSVVDRLADELPDAEEQQELSPQVLAELLSGMTPEELNQFIAENQRVFDCTNLPQFYANYAIDRWVVIRDKRATEEGLDQLLEDNLENKSAQWDKNIDKGIFRNLRDFLNTESNRLRVALRILRQPVVQKHLTERFGFEFEPDGPNTLEDLIRAHPETKLLFNQKPLSLNADQQKAYEFLKNIDIVYEPRHKLQDVLNNFRQANSLSFDLKWSRDRLMDELETFMLPMNTARNLEDMLAGDTLSLYELLRRDKKPMDIWTKVGLEKEFRQRFPTDDLLWDSSLSLFEIYNALEADHEKNSR